MERWALICSMLGALLCMHASLVAAQPKVWCCAQSDGSKYFSDLGCPLGTEFISGPRQPQVSSSVTTPSYDLSVQNNPVEEPDSLFDMLPQSRSLTVPSNFASLNSKEQKRISDEIIEEHKHLMRLVDLYKSVAEKFIALHKGKPLSEEDDEKALKLQQLSLTIRNALQHSVDQSLVLEKHLAIDIERLEEKKVEAIRTSEINIRAMTMRLDEARRKGE